MNSSSEQKKLEAIIQSAREWNNRTSLLDTSSAKARRFSWLKKNIIRSGKEQAVVIKGTGDVVLSCQSWSPIDIGLSSDNRNLGIAVRSIELLKEKALIH